MEWKRQYLCFLICFIKQPVSLFHEYSAVLLPNELIFTLQYVCVGLGQFFSQSMQLSSFYFKLQLSTNFNIQASEF